jgi:hypothetical protein
MTRVATLTMTAAQRDTLKTHLFPGDGKEAAALLLCGRRDGARRQRLLVREVHPVPYAACTRREVDSISWPIEWMDDLVDEAAARGLSLVKVHSHGVGYNRFSKADDASDTLLFPGLHALVEGSSPHASVVMTGDGAFFGRTVGPEGEFETLERITVVGDDIEIFYAEPPSAEAAGEVGRSTPAFGKAMTAEMARLLGAVIGASGTGGIVNEQLGRLGFGVVLQVDPEVVERKNLNRILNASAADAAAKLSKVEVAARAVAAMGLGSEPIPLAMSLVSREAVEAVAEADIVFGCMDSAEGRDVLSRLCAAFLVPYIDVGAAIRALDDGTIDAIEAVIHYLKPGGSSLLSREAYTVAQVAADALRRHDPARYAERVREKYIKGADEEMPAVISVNMTAAAMAVNEFLARRYGTRNLPNGAYGTTRINLAENEIESVAEGRACPAMAKLLGQGDAEPLLGLPELSA